MRRLVALVLLLVAGCATGSRQDSVREGTPVGREDVERLLAAGLSEGVMIDAVDRRGALHLTSDDLAALRKAGAGDALLEKMVVSETSEPDVVVITTPSHWHRYPYYYHPWFGAGYSPWDRWGGIGVHFGW